MEERDVSANYGEGHPRPGGPRRIPLRAPHGSATPARAAEFDVELPDLLPPAPPEEPASLTGALDLAGAPVPGLREPLTGIPDSRPWTGGAIPGTAPGYSLSAGIPHPLSGGLEPIPGSGLQARHPANLAPPGVPPVEPALGGRMGDLAEPPRKGLSPGGAFGMALLANAALALLAGIAVWAFPRETGEAIRRVANRLDLDVGGRSGEPVGLAGREPALQRLAILQLEDRVIHRGERIALEQLQRMGRELDSADPRFDAVQASLVRVRQSYQLSQSEVPAPLDPREILPGVESEKELPPTAIVDVLRNRRQSPAKRQRAAYLLAHERQSAAAQSALFHAIQDDPNLLVVRQAFQSFQELTGYPGRDFFDTDAIDRWWARNSASFIGQHAER